MLKSTVITREQLTGPLRTDHHDFISWTIYERPKDFPEHFVLRRWFLDRPDTCCQLFDTLEQAREALPQGLYRMPAFAEDDHTIREVWL